MIFIQRTCVLRRAEQKMMVISENPTKVMDDSPGYYL